MRKTVLIYGLIAGAILSAMMLAVLPFQEQIGFEYGALIGYTSMVLAFLMVFFGVQSYRDKVAGGQVGFGRALAVGLLITLVASACYVATWQLVYHLLAPDFIDKYVAYALHTLEASGATAAQIAEHGRQMAEFVELYKNPLVNIAFSLIEPLPVGVLFSLIAAAVLSRKRKPVASAVGQPALQ